MTAETFFFPPHVLGALEPAALAPFCPPLPVALEDPKAAAAREGAWVSFFDQHDPRLVRAAARLFPSTEPGTFQRWVSLRSAISAADELKEALFAPEPERCALLPLRDPEMYEFRSTIERLHWVASEVDLSRDPKDLKKVTEGDRLLIEHVLAFFSIADELVLEGLGGRLAALLPGKEAKAYLGSQENQENTHTEAYSLQIQEIVPSDRRDAVFNAVKTFPSVGRMADWVRWWTLAVHPAADLIAAMAFVEGAMFSGFFASLQHYKVKNVFPGITGLNEFICRDEGVHTLFWCFLLNQRLDRRPDAAVVTGIARETARLCEGFFRAAIPNPIPGINADLLGQYVRFVADSVAIQVGYRPPFGDPNPFPFMDMLALNEVAKSNFFEHRPTQYQSLGGKGALEFAVDTSEVRRP